MVNSVRVRAAIDEYGPSYQSDHATDSPTQKKEITSNHNSYTLVK